MSSESKNKAPWTVPVLEEIEMLDTATKGLAANESAGMMVVTAS